MKTIKFGDIRLTDISRNHVLECLYSNNITMGKKVAQFEDEFKDLFGYKYCTFMSSGTAANTAALIGLYQYSRVSIGGEVICPALTFVATWNSIRAAGFTPIPVDVCDDLNINPDLIEAAITSNTVGIMAVNLMGRTAKLDQICEIARKHKLPLIIDNCEAYGARYKGKLTLEYDEVLCETTSHYTAHCMISAEGGCVLTNNEYVDEDMRKIRNHGRSPASQYFDHPDYGLNFKNTDLHASIGLGEIPTFWNDFEKRKSNLHYLIRAMSKYSELANFTELDSAEYYHAPHAFNVVLKTPGRGIELLKQTLDKNHIEYKRTFGAFTQHGCTRRFGFREGQFPTAEHIGNNSIHVAVHKFLTNNDLERMCNTFDKFFTERLS